MAETAAYLKNKRLAEMLLKDADRALLNSSIPENYKINLYWPYATRDDMDPDELSTDKRDMVGWKNRTEMGPGMLTAVPGIAAEMANDQIKAAQMLAGERAIDPLGVGMAALDLSAPGVVSTMRKGPARGAILNANVWQGGPHKYGPKGASQSLKHIGKGEGATAYGWGRYDAGNDIVASQYRANVRNIDEDAFKRAGFTDREIQTARQYASQYLPEESDMAARDFSHWLGKELKPETNLAFKDAMGEGSYLYKHDLPDDDIARYLDWDKPLSEQPESVRAALDQFGYKADPEGLRNYDNALLDALDNNPNRALPNLPADPRGDEIYRNVARKYGDSSDPVAKQAASEALGRAGIPGLQYYDGMSRNAGEGTRNYVTWDQDVLDRMTLLERNGENMALPMDEATAKIADLLKNPHGEAIARSAKGWGDGKPYAFDPSPVDVTTLPDGRKYLLNGYHRAMNAADNGIDELSYINHPWTDDMAARVYGEMPDLKLLERNGENMALPMDEASRMARAREMGFDVDTPVYHGTADTFPAFSLDNAGNATRSQSAKSGVWTAADPATASGYAKNAEGLPVQKLIDASYAAERRGDWNKAHDLMAQAEKLEAGGGMGANVIPAVTRGKIKEIDMDGLNYDPDDINLSELTKAAKAEGYDGLRLRNFSDEAGYGQYRPTDHTVIFDPKNVRSRHATFDPAKADSPDLLASMTGTPELAMLANTLRNGGELNDNPAPVDLTQTEGWNSSFLEQKRRAAMSAAEQQRQDGLAELLRQGKQKAMMGGVL